MNKSTKTHETDTFRAVATSLTETLQNSGYLAYCIRLFEVTNSIITAKRGLSPFLKRPVPSLNRDIRVGRVFSQFRELFDLANVISAGYQKTLLSEVASSNMTLEERFKKLWAYGLEKGVFTRTQIVQLHQAFLKGAKGQLDLPLSPNTTTPTTGTPAQVIRLKEEGGGFSSETIQQGHGKIGDYIEIFGDQSGYWVALTPVTAAFGISDARVSRKLAKAKWSTGLVHLLEGTPFIHISLFTMFLALVDSNDFEDDLLEMKFTEFLETAPRVIYNFTKGRRSYLVPSDARLSAIEEKLDKMANAFDKAAFVAKAEHATVLPRYSEEEKGWSASSIIQWVNAQSPDFGFSIGRLKSIAVHLGLIGDTAFGHWDPQATGAHGLSGRYNWRFNDEGRHHIVDVAQAFIAKVPAKTTEAQRDVLWETTTLSFNKVGVGKYTNLTRDLNRDVRNENPDELPQA